MRINWPFGGLEDELLNYRLRSSDTFGAKPIIKTQRTMFSSKSAKDNQGTKKKKEYLMFSNYLEKAIDEQKENDEQKEISKVKKIK